MRRERNRQLYFRFSIFLVLYLLPALLAGCDGSDLKFPTEYQAVFLDNGQVFIGRLSGAPDSPYLTLRDVFYIKQQVTPEKKETQNVLIKRGSEWHGPDFMRLNTRHVVLIEPVAPDSRVAQLIREAKHPPPAAPKEEPRSPATTPKPKEEPRPPARR